MAVATAYGSFADTAGTCRRPEMESSMESMDWVHSRQITPQQQSSRQWSPSLSGSRWRASQASQRMMRSAKSEPIFRPPTSLFVREGFDSAARLPAISTPGGLTGTSMSTTLYRPFQPKRSLDSSAGRRTLHRNSVGPAIVRNTGCSIAGASASTALWSSSQATQGYPLSTSSALENRHTPKQESSTSRALDPPAKSSMLSGVSSVAEKENARRDQHIECLHLLPRNDQEKHDMRERRSLRRETAFPRTERFASIHEVAAEDFTEVSTNITSSISELRRRHGDFIPGASKVNLAEIKSAKHKHREQHEKEVRTERLKEFKMVRKIEPELPPLAPLPREERVPKVFADQAIVMRNTSQDAINVWLPKERLQRRLNWKEIHDERMRSAAQICEAVAEDRLVQCQRRAVERVQEALICQEEHHNEFRQQWLTMVSLVGFITRAREELTLRRMPMSDMLTYVDKHQDRLTSLGNETEFVKRAIHVNHWAKHPVIQNRLGCFVRLMQGRTAVNQQRKAAQAIFDSMLGWKTSGRVIQALFSFRAAVIHIQHWWCIRKKKLHEQRDLVAKRWIKIERAELMAEEKKKQNTAPVDRKMRGQQQDDMRNFKLHKAHLIDEPTRTKFIENELRTRRYLLLPKIELWEEDRRAWREQMDEWTEKQDALHLMAMPVDLALFRWPPVRPSFMPPAHFCEQLDHPDGKTTCSPACPGVEGDAMILDMWRRARKHPDNYTRVPDKKGAKPKIKRRGSKANLNAGNEDEKPEMGLYGPPPSTADTKRFGGGTDMPGVNIKGSMPALHEGQPRVWLSEMATASMTSTMVGMRARGRTRTSSAI